MAIDDRSNQPLFSPSRYRVCAIAGRNNRCHLSAGDLLASRILPPQLGRIALAGLFAFQLCFELRHGERDFLLSPAFLLAFLVLMAFSIIPSFLYQVLSWFDPLEVPSDDNLYLALPRLIIISYFGSQAESWILTFSAVGLTLHALIRILCGNAIENSPAIGTGRDYYRTLCSRFQHYLQPFYLSDADCVLQLVDDGFLSDVFRLNSVFRLAVSASFRDEQKNNLIVLGCCFFCAAVVAMVLAKQFRCQS